MVSIVCRNCPCAPVFLRVGQLIASHHVSATAIHRPMTAAGPDVQANPRRTPSVCDVRYLAGPEAIAANSHRHLPMLHAAAAAVRCAFSSSVWWNEYVVRRTSPATSDRFRFDYLHETESEITRSRHSPSAKSVILTEFVRYYRMPHCYFEVLSRQWRPGISMDFETKGWSYD